MPRPGPRPYECVRRAWHSERHQPIRGSLIQEIFRVANEIHSPATKRNKEWQVKLPDVVLQAERIMYSKANSEAEYMDLKTLWDRTNDAINIIIRRDESTETGEFLQPCIEAALFLGCTPRRASRSQRNCNPRFYLSPNASEVTSVSPSIVENAAQADYTIPPPQYISQAPNFVKPSSHLSSEHRNPFIQSSDRIVMTSQNVSPMCNYDQLLAMKNYAANNSYSSYPLYYGNRSFGLLPQPVSELLEPAKGCVPPNLPGNEDASKKNIQSGIRDGVENPCKIGCDLSLRLGPVCPNAKEWQPKDVKNVGSQEGGDICDQSSQLDRQFPFFPKSGSINGNSKSAFKNVEATMRKRKAAFDHPAEDPQFYLQPKLPLSHLTGSLRNTGS